MKYLSLKKLSLKTKMLSGSMISAILIASTGLIVYQNVKGMLQLQAQMMNSEEVMSRFSRLLNYVDDMETGIRGYLLSGDLTYLDPYNQAEGKLDKFVSETTSFLAPDSEQSTRWSQIADLKKQWIEGPAMETMFARRKLAAKQITQEEFSKVFESSRGHEPVNAIRQFVHDAIAHEESKISQLREKNTQAAQQVCNWVAFGLSTSIILGFTFLGLVTRGLSTSLQKSTNRLSQGSSLINEATHLLGKASQSLSSSATTTALSLQETINYLEEVSGLIKVNTEITDEAKSISQTCRDSAHHGELKMKELCVAMEEIIVGSKKIGEVNDVIDDIAFQTDLLALNASVEAARAGEHGKGFAVVAQAVRLLAQNCATAAKEINTLIQDATAKVDKGSTVVNESSKVLSTIVVYVKKVADLNADIASSYQKQLNGIEQINNNMEQIGGSTQNNATSTEQIANSIGGLSDNTILLQDLIVDLSTLIEGTHQTRFKSQIGQPKEAALRKSTDRKSA